MVNYIEEFEINSKTYIVTKFVRGGDLLSYLSERGVDKLPEAQAHTIFKQLTVGIRDIHEAGIVHRDLKHLNIFLSDTSETPRVKIGDFGLACRLREDECIKKMAGTIGFMAPEVIKDEPADFKSDVWSLGIILYALISSGVPFCGENRDKTAENIISQQLTFHREVWQTISDPCKDLLIRMLDKDQEARISIDEVLQHPWLSQEFQE